MLMAILRKKKKHLILIIGIIHGLLLHLSIASAQPRHDMPLGQFELEMGARPSAPYPQLDNYSHDLQTHGTGSNYTVPVSRHHIIPYNVLRSFYNRLSEQNMFRRVRSFFASYADNLHFYASSNGINCQSLGNDLIDAANLAQALGFGMARGHGTGLPLGYDTFEQFYTWLPGNLFIGPNQRLDDPGEGFESNSAMVVGADNYIILRRAYENMVRYNNGDDSVLGSIAADLNKISQRRSVYSLDPSNWVYVNGYYKLRTDTPAPLTPSSLTTQTLTTDKDDTCSEIKPSLLQHLIALDVMYKEE
jgi:hypothetical protein